MKVMIKKYSYLVLLLFVLAIVFQSCDKKTGEGTGDNKGDTRNSDLIKKDDKGEKVSLKMNPKQGDKFNYKFKLDQQSSEKSALTKDEKITSNQVMEMYYSQEVAEVNESGVAVYKIKYDSIKINYSISKPDSSISMVYNSNVKDSVYKMPDFITYNALIGRDFKVRVSPNGEVTHILDLEKVFEFIFKEYGDTLKPQYKSMIKEEVEPQLKEILQSAFQMFPENEIYKDSSWTYTQKAQMGAFPSENALKYTITKIDNQPDGIIIGINARLDFKILENVYKEKGVTFKLEDATGEGSGNIEFNISRGCIKKKDTTKSLKTKIKISQGSQSATSEKEDIVKVLLEMY